MAGFFPSFPAREGQAAKPRFPGASSASAGCNLRAGPRHMASRGRGDRTKPAPFGIPGPLRTQCQVFGGGLISWPAGQAEVVPMPCLSPNCHLLTCSFAEPAYTFAPSLHRRLASQGPLQPCYGPGAGQAHSQGGCKETVPGADTVLARDKVGRASSALWPGPRDSRLFRCSVCQLVSEALRGDRAAKAVDVPKRLRCG